MYLIKLIIGDQSQDGHGRTSELIIDANISSYEIKQAYKKGCKIVGFNLIKKFCISLNDSGFPVECINDLIKLGFDIKKLSSYMKEDEEDYLNEDEFSIIYLFIVSLGYPEFRYTFLESEPISIGGYGLFYI